MITDERKETIRLMVSNYRKQVEIVGVTAITLEKYLEGMIRFTSEEVAYGAMVYLLDIRKEYNANT